MKMFLWFEGDFLYSDKEYQLIFMERKCWPHKGQWYQIRFHYLLWGGSAKSQEVPELFQLKVGSSPSRNLHWSCHHKELLKLITSTLRFKVKSCKRSDIPAIFHTEPFSKKVWNFDFFPFLKVLQKRKIQNSHRIWIICETSEIFHQCDSVHASHFTCKSIFRWIFSDCERGEIAQSLLKTISLQISLLSWNYL